MRKIEFSLKFEIKITIFLILFSSFIFLPNFESMSICKLCHESYNINSLIKELSEGEPNFSYYGELTPEEIQNQLNIQLCGKCRLDLGKNTFSIIKGQSSGKQKLCPNCLWYGFNHPLNVDGKCHECGTEDREKEQQKIKNGMKKCDACNEYFKRKNIKYYDSLRLWFCNDCDAVRLVYKEAYNTSWDLGLNQDQIIKLIKNLSEKSNSHPKAKKVMSNLYDSIMKAFQEGSKKQILGNLIIRTLKSRIEIYEGDVDDWLERTS